MELALLAIYINIGTIYTLTQMDWRGLELAEFLMAIALWPIWIGYQIFLNFVFWKWKREATKNKGE